MKDKQLPVTPDSLVEVLLLASKLPVYQTSNCKTLVSAKLRQLDYWIL